MLWPLNGHAWTASYWRSPPSGLTLGTSMAHGRWILDAAGHGIRLWPENGS